MKTTKLSEAQIINMLNEAETGVTVTSLCRKYGIANSTYYKLKSKYGGLNSSELKRLRELETENNRLKQMYAEANLDKKILQEVLTKKFPGLVEKLWLKK